MGTWGAFDPLHSSVAAEPFGCRCRSTRRRDSKRAEEMAKVEVKTSQTADGSDGSGRGTSCTFCHAVVLS